MMTLFGSNGRSRAACGIRWSVGPTLAGLLLSLLAACTPTTSEVDPAKTMVISSEGNLDHALYEKAGIAIGDEGLFKSFARSYDDFVRHDAAGSRHNLVIVLNGGLNSAEAIIRNAARQSRAMTADGYYPFFIGWPTGLGDSYKTRVVNVRNGSRTGSHWWSSPFYVVSDILEGYGRSPITYGSATANYWRSYLFRDQLEYRRIYTLCADESLRVQRDNTITPEHNLIYSISEFTGVDRKAASIDSALCKETKADMPGSEFVGKALYAVNTIPRLVLTPAADSFGQSAWEEMVRRTRLTIRREIEVNGYAWNATRLSPTRGRARADEIERDMVRFPLGLGAIAQFFQRLADCTSKTQDKITEQICPEGLTEGQIESLRSAKITLVAHSMGAIVANEILSQMPDLPWANVVYMAAAASIRDTGRAITPVLARNDDMPSRTVRTRFFNLMLHPLNDAREQTLAGVGPAGSLLTYIDEMFENPKTPFDRTLGRWNNLREARIVFPERARKWMLFKVFDRAAGPRNPVTHGEFNDDGMSYWRPDFWGVCGLIWPDRARLCD